MHVRTTRLHTRPPVCLPYRDRRSPTSLVRRFQALLIYTRKLVYVVTNHRYTPCVTSWIIISRRLSTRPPLGAGCLHLRVTDRMSAAPPNACLSPCPRNLRHELLESLSSAICRACAEGFATEARVRWPLPERARRVSSSVCSDLRDSGQQDCTGSRAATASKKSTATWS